jgi:hypothetical protein
MNAFEISLIVVVACVGWIGLIAAFVLLGRMERLLREMVEAVDDDGAEWPTETFIDDWLADAKAVIEGQPAPERKRRLP